MNKSARKKHAKFLKTVRKIHRKIGTFLFIFFFILSISGILLTWKKHSYGLILSKSYTGSSTDFKDWLPIDSLHKNACKILLDSVSSLLKTDIKRIDIKK